MAKSLKRRIKGIYQPPAVAAARVWRRYLKGPEITGITGSCGKSSAKEFADTVLGTYFRGTKNFDTTNNAYSVARTLFATRPWHNYLVQEIGAFSPGTIDRAISVLRPTIGVITNIGSDHFKSFRGADAVAVEKRKIVDCLPDDGTAILNIDDSRVAKIAESAHVPVLGFGTGHTARLRAENISCAFPGYLAFDSIFESQHARVETQLVGANLLDSVLAAIGAGLAHGLTLEQAARPLKNARPLQGRMQHWRSAKGIDFIDDSYKAPYWSLGAVFDFVSNAKATRKWLIIGTISDHNIKPKQLYPKLTERALECADHVVFIGKFTRYVRPVDGKVMAFENTADAKAIVDKLLSNGDLVYLKGLYKDQLARLTEA